MAKITANLTSGMVVQLSNGRHEWRADEPVAAGGTDTGPVLAALFGWPVYPIDRYSG